jgi:hypothetical protein
MPPAAPQKPGLSFITLLSYDYRYAFTAIRSYYDIAGEIILGLDADRLTWSQHPFQIDMDELHSQIKQIDIAHKLRLVEGNFHASQRPMDNDTNERSELSLQCSPGNWIVQIDCDETLMNAREFRDWLINCDPQKRVHALWFSVFKVYGDRALVIHPRQKRLPSPPSYAANTTIPAEPNKIPSSPPSCCSTFPGAAPPTKSARSSPIGATPATSTPSRF